MKQTGSGSECLVSSTRNVESIAKFFLEQKLSLIFGEEQKLSKLKNNLGNPNLSSHTQAIVNEVVLISKNQIHRVEKIANTLKVSLQQSQKIICIGEQGTFFKAVNEDLVYGDFLQTTSQRQSQLMFNYEEALNFAETLTNHSAKELLKEAYAEAKKSDILLKRAGLRLVSRLGGDLGTQRAVMT